MTHVPKQIAAMLPVCALALVLAVWPAASRAADAITLTLGGRIQEYFFVAGQDHAPGENLNNAGMVNDVRFSLEGQTVLDNGVTIRSYVRVFAVGRAATDVDEAYVDVVSTFGRLRMGEKAGVNASTIGDPVPEAFLTVDDEIVGDELKARTGLTLHDAFTFKRFTGNALGLSYQTPEVFGFKVGVAYHPTPTTDLPYVPTAATPVAPLNVPALGLAAGAVGPIDNSLLPHNAVDVTAGYDGEFTGGTYRLAGGYFHLASHLGGNDGTAAWNLSAGATYGGWEAAGAYMHVMPATGLTENDWVVGGLYGIGPFQVSADYRVLDRRMIIGALRGERVDRLTLQTAYKMGPGISLGLGGFYANQRDAAGNGWDGGGVLSGLKIGF